MMYEELSDYEKTIVGEFLRDEKTGMLSMVDSDGYPYSIPINFHYMRGSVYMHGGVEGKKIDLLNQSAKTQFAVFREYAYIPSYVSGSVACSAGYYFLSVLFSGETRFVEPVEERAEILREMMMKYQPEGKFDRMGDMSVYGKRLEATLVFFLKPERISVKLKFGQTAPAEKLGKIKSFLAERGLPDDLRTIDLINRLRTEK